MQIFRTVKFLLILSACALVLSSCGSAATIAQFEETLASWINKDERELLHVWGIPDDVYQISEDEKALIYVNQSSFTIPGTAPSYITNYIGDTAYTTTYPGRAPQTFDIHCKVDFFVKQNKIYSFRWEGNGCR